MYLAAQTVSGGINILGVQIGATAVIAFLVGMYVGKKVF